MARRWPLLRRWLTFLTALSMLIGLVATPALARGGPPMEHPGRGKGKQSFLAAFGDLGEASWALPHIAQVKARGLMKGQGGGIFAPGKPLTRAEAVTAAIRLLELEDEALASTDTGLPFSDARKVPQWAVPYLAAAVAADILPPLDGDRIEADRNATRLWVSVLLVKALGLADEAEASSNRPLPFKDGHRVPASLRGYVAVAVAHGLVNGYGDVTFRPDQPVSRAEMAALMARTDSQLDRLRPRQGSLQGKIAAVDTETEEVTLRAGGKRLTLALADDAALFLDEEPATLADLAAGMPARVILNQQGQILVLLARTPDADEDEADADENDNADADDDADANDDDAAEHDDADADEDENDDADTDDQDDADADEDDEADADQNDQADADEDDADAGDDDADADEDDDADADDATVSGTVQALTWASESQLATVTVSQDGDETRQDPLAPGAAILINGAEAAFADILIGDVATLTLADGLVTQIEIERATATVAGTFRSYTPAGDQALSLVVLDAGDIVAQAYYVATYATVTLNGREATLADLQEGDPLELSLVGASAVAIAASHEVSGTVTALAAATDDDPAELTLRLANGTDLALTVADDADITVDGEAATFADLQPGDSAVVQANGEVAVGITVNR